jgi:hypothetical protein
MTSGGEKRGETLETHKKHETERDKVYVSGPRDPSLYACRQSSNKIMAIEVF